MKPSHRNFVCIDCKKDTWNEYYMIHTSTWKKAHPKNKGMLCIKCLEIRLGRKLTSKDFNKVPINLSDTKRTNILVDRLGDLLI